MKRIVGVIILALLLAVVGVVSLMAGRIERRMGVALEDMAVLDFADPQAEYAVLQQDLQKLPWANASRLQEIRARRAALEYWQGDYGDLVAMAQKPAQDGEPVDPDLQLLAANASYRAAQRGPQDKVTVLQNLDNTIRAYAEALRAGSDRPDAAYNYELAVRMRDELVAGKRKGLPSGPTIDDTSDAAMHGDLGEPPKDMKVEQFQIRIPMDAKDFKSSQEQTAGRGQQRLQTAGDEPSARQGNRGQLLSSTHLRFGEPLYLWLLSAPAPLLCLWFWRIIRRRSEARRYQAVRLVPVRERFGSFGELAFWLCLIAALSLTILALARPQAVTSIVRSPGADIVLLVDGSASMRVTDVGTDRWQRAMAWMRTLTQSLAWDGDRLALATFADIALPQIRLTRDPNTVLFFLDHLDKEPTFKLQDDTSWDTNVEDAIYWGSSWSRPIRRCTARARTRRPSSSSPTVRFGAVTSSVRSRLP